MSLQRGNDASVGRRPVSGEAQLPPRGGSMAERLNGLVAQRYRSGDNAVVEVRVSE